MGEVKTALLDGDSKNYDMERGFSRHPIDETTDKGMQNEDINGARPRIDKVRTMTWNKDFQGSPSMKLQIKVFKMKILRL